MRQSNTNFTDRLLRNLKAPATGRLEMSDAGCRGLHFRLTSAGAASFSFRYQGERVNIGPYPEISLQDARAKADELRGDVRGGKDPAAHKRSAGERTFAVLADRYIQEHARRHKRTPEKDAWALGKYVLPYWAKRDATTIERADVIKLLERIVKAGTPIMANRVQALVSRVFSFGIDVSLIKNHPSHGLSRRAPERVCTRVLSDDEIKLFWDRTLACRQGSAQRMGLALRLLLVLGTRTKEVAGMKRSELELDAKGKPISWTLPGERSKNRKALFVPLSPLAQDLISKLLAMTGGDAVLPSPLDPDKSIYAHSLTKAMDRLTANIPAGAPGAKTWAADPPTAHDLRRTMATRMAKANVPHEHIAACLNHKKTDVTGIHYVHDLDDQKAQAWATWAQTLSAILDPAPTKVLAFRR